MKKLVRKENLKQSVIVGGVFYLFICLCIIPSMASIFREQLPASSLIISTETINEGDIPTWYQGDEWTYTIDPLYYSGPNGSFSGNIENFKQKVVGITDGLYEIELTGEISGDLVMSEFSGECSGEITGTSHVRVSDLAEETTDLHSQGTITVWSIPLPYELDLITSSSPLLELYDFPLHIEEQWQIGCMNTMSGSFTIQGLYDQSMNDTQWIEEIVQCTQMEQVSVPAGMYDCYTISRADTIVWYSTDVGNTVKSTIDQSDENMTVHAVINLQSFSNAAQPITVSEEISPVIVLPGSQVVISGQAITTSSGDPVQNGTISVEIPSTGDSWIIFTDSDGNYSKTIVAPTISDDTPCGRETGSGGVIVQCVSGSLTGNRVQTLTTIYNTPPNTPSIDGETKGKVGVSYTYTIGTEDPETDDVLYYVDWGDLTNSSWVGPYSSYENIALSHTYTKKGTYPIRVKAKDVFQAESAWETLEVKMPASISFHPFLQFFERSTHGFPILRYLLDCLN